MALSWPLAEAVADLSGEDVAVRSTVLTLCGSPDSMAAADAHAERVGGPRAGVGGLRLARLWVISNEVGWEIVPDNALARRFLGTKQGCCIQAMPRRSPRRRCLW
jgi:adenosylcobinamide kinase/adenosylcobinamide-phosphate guanylyltransferase